MNSNIILCPYDFTQGSDVAIHYASLLAARSNGTMHFLHVFEPSYASVDAQLPTNSRFASQIEPLLRELESVKPRGEIPYRHQVVVGAPAEEILRYAADHKVRMIVMVTHGRSGVARAFMGNVAETVVRRAHCPVLTIKLPFAGGQENREMAELRTEAIERILCPVDFSPTSEGALVLASQLARDYGAHLSIVHVEENPATVRPSLLGLPPEAIEASHQLATFGPSEPGVAFEHDLLVGPVAETLVEFAAQKHIDLIVMGSHGRTGILRALLGSVAEKVVREASVPVMVFKPEVHAESDVTLGVPTHE